MRDAIGGVVNVAFIVVFLVIVSGYLAFSVSWNKAYKVKNKIISVLEQYEYHNEEAKKIIKDYLSAIGYNVRQQDIERGLTNKCYKCEPEGYCVRWTQDNPKSTGLPNGHYSVATTVYIDVPIFNKFLPFMTFLRSTGDTKSIYISQDSGTSCGIHHRGE